MRSLAIRGSLIASSLVFVGCGDAKKNEPAPASDAKADAPPAETKPPTAEAPAAPSPPPAPEGAVSLTDPALFVQTCADPHPCPDLLQAAGEKHCAELTLGSVSTWRLPTREEVQRMRGTEGLSALSGYHWTNSAFDQDDAQVWIVDPNSDQPTTVPRDRKPFRIRCVREP
jgi:hypothetical protein